MFAEDAVYEEDFAGCNVQNKDAVHEMVSIFTILALLNPECEVSQVDVEEWINADKGIEVSRTIADEDLINAVTNPEPESKTLDNESSDEKIVTEKISWAKTADAFSTPLKSAESRPCSSSQEVMQLHIWHSTFMQKRKELTKQAGVRQMFKKACKSHTDSPVVFKGAAVVKPGGM
jgi:hypothetical protein